MFILGADGVSLEEGLTTPSLGLAGVERAMIRQTRGEVIVLADRSKIGVVGDVVICPLDDVQTIIVDDGVDGDVRDEMLPPRHAGGRRVSRRSGPRVPPRAASSPRGFAPSLRGFSRPARPSKERRHERS